MTKIATLTQAETMVLYQTAFDLFQQQRYQQALPLALQLSAARPDDWRFHFLSAMTLQFLGDIEAAIPFYGYTLILDPACTPAVFRLAECLEKNAQHQQARQLYESVIEQGRKEPQHHALQGLAQARLRALH
ncbi:MAG: tetratricopeptide repeat protein [Burkholderiaceae bacterium]